MAVEEDPPAAVPDWVVTFGDMMSLLLTFFIMIASMSQIKKDDQYQAMAESMRKRFGHDFDLTSLVPGASQTQTPYLDNVSRGERSNRSNINDGGTKVSTAVGDFPRVRSIPHKEISRLGGIIYFEEGQTELTEQERRQLQLVVEEVGGKPQKIEIRGHTSRLPASLKPLAKDMQGRFVDNWHLAYTRCHNVMEILISLGIDPARIRLNVAGEFEPLYSGSNAVERQKNERVEVFMLDERVPEQDVSASELPAGKLPSPALPTESRDE